MRRALVLAACIAVLGATPAPVRADDLAARLAEIVRAGETAGRTWAVRVDRLDTGETVYAHRADAPRTPASTAKLFTTAAALHRLGPDFTITTSVYGTGPVIDGVLRGNVVLYGRGDPNISGRFYDDDRTAVLEELAGRLRARGIRRVTGDVIGDGTYFEDKDFGPWNVADQHRWYAARVSALSFNDNCIDVFVGPGKRVGAPAALRWEPFTRYVRVILAARTVSGRRRNVYGWRAMGSNRIGIDGTIGERAHIQPLNVTVEEPQAYAAWVFRDVLARSGIAVDGRPRGLTRAQAGGPTAYEHELARHVSQPLSEIIGVINGRSQNLHAELLCKTLGKESGGDGSWADGLAAARAALCDLGVCTDEVRLADGSGLSRENRATASALVGVLEAMTRHRHAAAFERSLIAVGEDAGLTDLAKSIRYGELKAKTGSLKGVLALAGYVHAPHHAPLAFAMIGTDPQRRSATPLKATRDELAYRLVRDGP